MITLDDLKRNGWQSAINQVVWADCLEGMKLIPDKSIDLILTDPPYELGFMGKSWDSTGIANSIEMWSEALRILKPGGYLLAFSATRTYHRMASSIEDAGFEVRDMIEWVYGSGFPKSLNIGKAVDKLQGNEREVTGTEKIDIGMQGGSMHSGRDTKVVERSVTKGTSEWEGWGTALKPAHEPICMARKPLEASTVAENVLKYGTGGINIDESRVEYQGDADWKNTFRPSTNIDKNCWIKDKNAVARVDIINRDGRFPANLIHDNSEEVRECFPDSKSVKATNVQRKDCPNTAMSGRNYARFNEEEGYSDSGNASRFFKSIIYQAKASKSDRGEENSHPTVKPIALMKYLIKMASREGALILDPFMGSWTTARACEVLGRDFIGFELEESYCKVGEERLKQGNLF